MTGDSRESDGDVGPGRGCVTAGAGDGAGDGMGIGVGAGAGEPARSGTLEQAATHRSSASGAARIARVRIVWRSRAMAWLALEIALGLALFIGIVWWTLPKKEKESNDRPPE